MGDLLVRDTVAAGVVDRQLGHLKAHLHAGLVEEAHDGAQLALVAAATAEVAGELARELLARGDEARVLLGGAGERQNVHDEAGGAKTALLGAFGSHRTGQRLGLGLEALERGDGAALDARGGNRAAQHRVAVEPHRAQAAVGGLAGAAHRRATLLTQKRKEHGIGGNLNLDLATVERKGKIDEFGSHYRTSLESTPGTRRQEYSSVANLGICTVSSSRASAAESSMPAARRTAWMASGAEMRRR